MSKEEVFRRHYEVHSYDTDVTRQLSLSGLANFMQDIASFHADKLGLGYDYFLAENKAWVLRQLKIETCGRAWWKDKVMIETWPKAPDRLFAYRDFLVFDGNGTRIAKASSSWLLIDMKLRRPVRMDPAMFEKYQFRKDDVFAEKIRTLPKTGTGEKIFETGVRYSRLDMNDHVNNVEFISWVLDAYYAEHVPESYPVTFEIQYDHEVLLGDEIGIYRNNEISGKEIYYSILRLKDGKEVALSKVS